MIAIIKVKNGDSNDTDNDNEEKKNDDKEGRMWKRIDEPRTLGRARGTLYTIMNEQY